jgi:hypothetical protein
MYVRACVYRTVDSEIYFTEALQFFRRSTTNSIVRCQHMRQTVVSSDTYKDQTFFSGFLLINNLKAKRLKEGLGLTRI